MITPVNLPQGGLPPALPAASGATAISELLDLLQPGQLLAAQVLGEVRDGMVTLDLGGTPVQARTDQPLVPGQTLRLQVQSTGETPVLQVLDGGTSTPDPVAQALRVALPRQLPVAEAVATLAAASGSRGAQGSRGVPADGVRAALDAVLAAIPDTRTLSTPDGVAGAVADSGLLLEARLGSAATTTATPPNPGPGDLKAVLMKLVGALEQAPARAPAPSSPASGPSPAAPAPAHAPRAVARATPQPATTPAGTSPPGGPLHAQADGLHAAAQGALSRIQANQLQSLAREHAGIAVWVTELPFVDRQGTGAVELRVRREPRHDKATRVESGTWRVSVDVDLGQAGKLHARLGLSAGIFSTGLWAEDPVTAERAARGLDGLRAALEARGIKVGGLHCRAGTPPPEAAPAPALLDTRA